jgi:hypothetical protein
MTWSKSFTGTRQQISETIATEGLPEQAQPSSAAAEFIQGQIPDEGKFVVSAYGDRHRSDDGKSGSASIAVNFSAIADEAVTETSTENTAQAQTENTAKAEESAKAETADAA